VLETADATCQGNYGRALDHLVRGYHFTDVWNHNSVNRGFTRYTATGVSRLDRIYASHIILAHKQGVETLAAAFTDDMALDPQLAGTATMLTHR
jgi:hypothetical protein